ncbi:MAG: serine/threonine protein kinase, partial [Gemmataceae bacterium]|nr:serine/threonine protein kinase [Gemmataceae bacterium]
MSSYTEYSHRPGQATEYFNGLNRYSNSYHGACRMPMSTTPTTGEEFLETVVQSGLLTPDQLKPYARAGDGPDEHRALANRLIKDRLLTPFQVRQLLAGKVRGYFLADKYKVLALVGTGGKGPVLLCEHLRLQQLVAAKLIQRATADEAGELAAALERFVREALAVPALDHPNIVRVHDVERAGPVPFVVMDYVDGASLHQIVAQSGALPLNRAAYYIRQAAVGLRHAHGKGLIHRDIKPGNLLLDRTGVVKLLDLGLGGFFRDLLARNGNGGDGETEDPAAAGAADYISPEQASHSAGPMDNRSDVYSLGATLYYLLAGRAPFEGESYADKLMGLQFREPVPVRELRPDVPAGLAEVLARMMAKHPNDRHQTLAGVIADLGPWARDPVPPPPSAEMPRVPASAYRLGLVSGPGQSVPTPELLSEVRWGLGFPLGSPAGGTGTYTPAAADARTPARPAAPATPPPSMIRRPGPGTSVTPAAPPPTAARPKGNRNGTAPAFSLLPDELTAEADGPPPPAAP